LCVDWDAFFDGARPEREWSAEYYLRVDGQRSRVDTTARVSRRECRQSVLSVSFLWPK